MMSSEQAMTAITVHVELNQSTGEPVFTYLSPTGLPIPSGNVAVTEAGTITYTLEDKTGKNLRFVGAGFTTPFDGIIDSVAVGNGGLTLTMEDSDKTAGKTKFQFVLSNTANTLLILSPDPEVKNEL